MGNHILLYGINVEELKDFISKSVTTGIQNFLSQENEKQDQLINVEEVTRLLNVSKVTVFKWKKEGRIPFYRIGRRIFFKKQEVLDSLKKIERRIV